MSNIGFQIRELVNGFDIDDCDNRTITNFQKIVEQVKKITDIADKYKDINITLDAAFEISNVIDMKGRYTALKLLLNHLQDAETDFHGYKQYLLNIDPSYNNSDVSERDFSALIFDTMLAVYNSSQYQLDDYIDFVLNDFKSYLDNATVNNKDSLQALFEDLVTKSDTKAIDLIVSKGIVGKKVLLIETESLDETMIIQTLRSNYEKVQLNTSDVPTLLSISSAHKGIHIEKNHFLKIIDTPISYILNIPERYCDAFKGTLIYYGKHNLLPISILDYMAICPDWQNSMILDSLG
jgi:hypothetical protein